jgi:Domain of unknown function (DUF4349)
MSEASFETVLAQLRDRAPSAPDGLREHVRALRPIESRLRPWLRPALVAVVIVALGVSALAALVSSGHKTLSEQNSAQGFQPKIPAPQAQAEGALRAQGAPTLTAKSRLQRQDVDMRLRVKDLSGATQSALRTTRRLGGFVAGADYATGSKEGNSRLVLRVPVANLQQAIASFTNLGTILSQHISVADLQTGLDRLDARIAAARRKGHDHRADRLERRRDALIREGTYARILLQLTTAKPAAQHSAPGQFGRFWDTTGNILGKELIAMLYVLVLAGPFILLAALLVFAERTRRRRADQRLLEEAA